MAGSNTPEAHFDALARQHEQMQLQVVGDGRVEVGPWVATVGDPGPYCIARPAPKQPGRLVVLTCNRPARHGGTFHQAADDNALVLAQWGRDGRAIYPKPVPERGQHGSDVPV